MENKNKLELIVAWIKAHPLFKWAAMCEEVGFDKGNFHRVLNSDSPTMNADFIPKMIKVMKRYGFVEPSEGLPDTGILIPLSSEKDLKFSPVPGFEGYEKVTVKDLTKPTGRKVVSDPPPKTNVTINTMPVKKKGEDAIDFAARKNEWKRKQSLQK